MFRSILYWFASQFEQLLPPASFPRDDHRRRIRASFILALASLQFAGSLLFSLTELVVGHWVLAGLLGLGALLPLWPGMRMRRDGDVDRWAQVFVANMFILLSVLLLASGGQSMGVVMAFPALLLISSFVSNARQIVFWGLVVIAVLLLGSAMRAMPGPWLINIDPEWARGSINRVPVVLTVCMIGMSVLLRALLDSVFADLAAARANELEALARAHFDQQRFADFAGIAADWFWETDANLRLIYVSPGITRHTGLQPSQVLGMHPIAIVQQRHPDAPELRAVESRMARGEPFEDERMAWRDEAGELAMFRHIGRPLRDAEGHLRGYRGVVTNITETWRLTRELERLARTEPLTGLLNSRAFGQQLAQALQAVRERDEPYWLLLLHLDQVKALTESGGLGLGDRVLLRVTELLRECGLPADSLARIGGESFCALVREPEAESVSDFAELLLAGLARLEIEFAQALGAGIGILRLKADIGDESAQLQAADQACQRARREGGRVVVA